MNSLLIPVTTALLAGTGFITGIIYEKRIGLKVEKNE